MKRIRASPSYYAWIFSGAAVSVCVFVCGDTYRWFMYKQEHQQSDNKFFWGLWTPNSFLHKSHGRSSPCCFWCYSQLTLNNRRLFILNVALIWHLNVLIPVQITKCAFVNIWSEWAAGLVNWIRSSKIYFNLNLLLVFSCLWDTFCVRILWPFGFQHQATL